MLDKKRCIRSTCRLCQFFLLLCAGTMPAAVVYANGINWDFSGFGTLAGVKTDEDLAKYRLELLQGDGADSDGIDWGLRSSLGAQFTVDFGEQFSLTAQAVAKRRGQDDMDPDFEWLYASYRPASWLDIRAGRLVMPELLVSDYRQVGYAQPTVTPPALVYIWASVTSFKGTQIYNRIPLGNGLLTLQTSVGEGDEDFWVASEPMPFGLYAGLTYVNVEFKNLQALNVMYEWDDWLVRAIRLEHDLKLAGFPGSLEQTFKGYALQYDNGRLLVMAESIDREDAATAQYVLLGWRFGQWLPSVTFAQSAVTDQITQQDIDYDSRMVALRYDITQSMAIKLQWEESPADFAFTANSQWLDTYPGFSGDRKVISFGLDFVF